MAALIGKVESVRGNTVHRLGHKAITVEAATWQTFATVTLRADGSGVLEIRRGGKLIETRTWDKE